MSTPYRDASHSGEPETLRFRKLAVPLIVIFTVATAVVVLFFYERTFSWVAQRSIVCERDTAGAVECSFVRKLAGITRSTSFPVEYAYAEHEMVAPPERGKYAKEPARYRDHLNLCGGTCFRIDEVELAGDPQALAPLIHAFLKNPTLTLGRWETGSIFSARVLVVPFLLTVAMVLLFLLMLRNVWVVFYPEHGRIAVASMTYFLVQRLAFIDLESFEEAVVIDVRKSCDVELRSHQRASVTLGLSACTSLRAEQTAKAINRAVAAWRRGQAAAAAAPLA